MAIFPKLSSGAVSQYPTVLNRGHAVQVIRFLDGSDQRCLSQGRTSRQWRIQLTLLNEFEIAQLEQFFISQQGNYSTFAFPDPISGANVPNCRFGEPGVVSEYVATDTSSVSFWVIETNG